MSAPTNSRKTPEADACAENADETGYVTDVGFIKDFDTMYDRARALLTPKPTP